MAVDGLRFCETCHKTKKIADFYQSNNLEKYPDRVMNMCKSCMTMLVDNYDPKTYLWILQEADVPYIPEEWDKLLKKHGADPAKLTGATIMGRYLAKMKLKQFQDYRWVDTENLQKINESRIKDTMLRQGYSMSEIDPVLEKEKTNNLQEIADLRPDQSALEAAVVQLNQLPIAAPGNQGMIASAQIPQEDLGLTEEDIQYLSLKWGRTYRQDEWVWLEKLYNDMEASYDIQGAGHEDTLKLLCKTSLKCNTLIDIGDIDGFQKASRVYDQLMKSGAFTAAQNKADKGEAVDSISEIVEMCEREGYIERYYISKPNDMVDETLADMHKYTEQLVMNETNLTDLMEAALKGIQREDEESEANDTGEVIDDVELSDQDYNDFFNFREDDAEQDAEDDE